MVFVIMTLCAAVLLAVVWIKRAKDLREIEQRHTITPEALHALVAADEEVLVIDVRHPLDMLGDSVIIPSAQWFAPDQVRANPALLSKEQDLVVYCTCRSGKTSRMILHQALAMGFRRIKFLKGGLDGWRSKGFPVEPYTRPIYLNSDSSNHLAATR